VESLILETVSLIYHHLFAKMLHFWQIFGVSVDIDLPDGRQASILTILRMQVATLPSTALLTHDTVTALLALCSR